MKSKTIKISGKEVVVKALPFRKVLDILKYIKTLPEKVKGSLAEINTQNVKQLDNVVAMGIIADILHESGDEIIDILAVASDLPAKEVENLSIAEATRLIKALLEVNDIEEIKKEFGELGQMFKDKKDE